MFICPSDCDRARCPVLPALANSERRTIVPATKFSPLITTVLPYFAIVGEKSMIAGAFETPKVLFILRDPADWASSHRHQSRDTIGAVHWATILKGSLFALGQLAQRYAVRVGYYEDFRRLPVAPIVDLLASTGWTGAVTQQTLDEVARKDSHEGAADSRDVVGDVPPDPVFREEFAREWRRVRPAELIDRLELRGL